MDDLRWPYDRDLAHLPDWALGMDPKVTHGEWEIDPTVEPVEKFVATDVQRGPFWVYVAEYTKVLVHTMRRGHRETWRKEGYYRAIIPELLTAAAFETNLDTTLAPSIESEWVPPETWGRWTWERKDCGQ